MYYPKMKGICINILREDKAVVDDLALKYLDKGKRYDFISLSEIEEEFSTILENDSAYQQSIQYEEIMSAIDNLPEGYKKISLISHKNCRFLATKCRFLDILCEKLKILFVLI